MTEFVRVRLENGSEASIPARAAEAAGLKPLKKPALGRDGRPLSTKHRTFDRPEAATESPTTEAPASEPSQED